MPVLLVSKNYDGHGTSDRCFPVSMILGWWSGSREVLGTADKAVAVGECVGNCDDYGRFNGEDQRLRKKVQQ